MLSSKTGCFIDFGTPIEFVAKELPPILVVRLRLPQGLSPSSSAINIVFNLVVPPFGIVPDRRD